MCVTFDIASKNELFLLFMIGNFCEVYTKFTIYENVIMSNDIQSTIFVLLDVHSNSRADVRRDGSG